MSDALWRFWTDRNEPHTLDQHRTLMEHDLRLPQQGSKPTAHLPDALSALRRAALNGSGQSSVEFAVVMAGFLSLTVALSALWHAFDGGMFVQHAINVASHHIQSVAPVTVTDLFLY